MRVENEKAGSSKRNRSIRREIFPISTLLATNTAWACTKCLFPLLLIVSFLAALWIGTVRYNCDRYEEKPHSVRSVSWVVITNTHTSSPNSCLWLVFVNCRLNIYRMNILGTVKGIWGCILVLYVDCREVKDATIDRKNISHRGRLEDLCCSQRVRYYHVCDMVAL